MAAVALDSMWEQCWLVLLLLVLFAVAGPLVFDFDLSLLHLLADLATEEHS